MTDTDRHDSPADRRQWNRLHRGIKHQAQKVRDGQGQLTLYSQFPGNNPHNRRGSFLRRTP